MLGRATFEGDAQHAMPGKGGANAAGRGIQRGELMTHLDDLRQEILSRERDLQRRYEQLKSDVQVLKKAQAAMAQPAVQLGGQSFCSHMWDRTHHHPSWYESIAKCLGRL